MTAIVRGPYNPGMNPLAQAEVQVRIFAPKPPPEMLRCPFPLRRDMQIEVTLPRDLVLKDLRRFVWYLVTMCDDWDVDDGLPGFMWPERKKTT